MTESKNTKAGLWSRAREGRWLEIVGFIAILASLERVATIWDGANNHIKTSKKQGMVGWEPDRFADLAWEALGLLVLSLVLSLVLPRTKTGLLNLVAAASPLLVAGAVALYSMAWAAERQNYWDTYHFVSLFWMAQGAIVVGFVATSLSSRRGSHWGRTLHAPTSALLIFGVIAWFYTWSPLLKDLVAYLSRLMFLATHA